MLDVRHQTDIGYSLLRIRAGADLSLSVGSYLPIQQRHLSPEPEGPACLAELVLGTVENLAEGGGYDIARDPYPIVLYPQNVGPWTV